MRHFWWLHSGILEILLVMCIAIHCDYDLQLYSMLLLTPALVFPAYDVMLPEIGGILLKIPCPSLLFLNVCQYTYRVHVFSER